MIQVSDPKIPNLDVVGLMALTQWEWANDTLGMACPCESCDEILAEAWERMTDAGVGFLPACLDVQLQSGNYLWPVTIEVLESAVVAR